jgi:peroxiredoxin
VQLQGRLSEFQQAGIGVAALTYDSPALQQKFIDRFAITYPLLSDIDATSITNLGILNTEYAPGDPNYGIPYPGVFVLDPDLRIVGKIFLDGYDKRVSADGVLAYARQVLH